MLILMYELLIVSAPFVWVRCSFGNGYRVKHFSTPRKIKEEVFTILHGYFMVEEALSQLTCATVTILV